VPEKLTGLIAAPFTPLTSSGEIDLNKVPAVIDHLVKAGLTGVFVCGSTGEGSSLTTAERMAVNRAFIAAARGRITIITHVGQTSIKESQALAADAQAAGAAAIGSLSPYYFKPTDVDTLVDCCRDVAAAAPKLPFFYYQIPSLTGVSLKVSEFLARGADRIPTLAGAKFTHEDLMDYLECLRMQNGRFQVLFGRDEMLLSALAAGATGAVGSTYNFIAPLFHKVIAAFNANDLASARASQHQANRIIQCFLRAGGLPAAKAMMKMIGVDCGPMRLPIKALSEAQLKQLESDLRAARFFEITKD
jgi:N-acetylneuraminate lyase